MLRCTLRLNSNDPIAAFLFFHHHHVGLLTALVRTAQIASRANATTTMPTPKPPKPMVAIYHARAVCRLHLRWHSQQLCVCIVSAFSSSARVQHRFGMVVAMRCPTQIYILYYVPMMTVMDGRKRGLHLLRMFSAIQLVACDSFYNSPSNLVLDICTLFQLRLLSFIFCVNVTNYLCSHP